MGGPRMGQPGGMGATGFGRGMGGGMATAAPPGMMPPEAMPPTEGGVGPADSMTAATMGRMPPTTLPKPGGVGTPMMPPAMTPPAPQPSMPAGVPPAPTPADALGKPLGGPATVGASPAADAQAKMMKRANVKPMPAPGAPPKPYGG